jgi:signal peptidase
LLRYAAAAFLFLALAVLVAPSVSPVSLSYVLTDSMEPTIDSGDGYILVETGDVDVGDIVTYRFDGSGTEAVSEKGTSPIQVKTQPGQDDPGIGKSGGYITHRVVGETDGGYLTKGDNNPSTDQAAGFPVVSDTDIVGKVVQVGDSPLTIPNLGDYILFVSENRFGVTAVFVILALLSYLSGDGGRSRPGRDVVYVRDIAVPAFLAVLLLSSAFMFVSVETKTANYVVTESQSESPSTLNVGEPTQRNITTTVDSLPFTRNVVQAEGFTIDSKTKKRSEGSVQYNISVTIPAQESLGSHMAAVDVYTYPAVVPSGVLKRLHSVSSLVAWFVSVGIIFLPVYAVYRFLLYGDAPLRAPKSRSIRRFWRER